MILCESGFILGMNKIVFESDRKNPSDKIDENSERRRTMKAFLQVHWKLVLSFNLLLGIALWFGYLTDVSLRGTILDYLFPPFVTLFALITLKALPYEKKKYGRLGYIPSLAGGCSYLLMVCIMLIPPFTLGFLFSISEVMSEVEIQRVMAPNNVSIAEVYFRPVGAYTSGSGYINIRVLNKFIPFIERDVYSLKSYSASEEASDYVQWIDNDTLHISETDENISIGGVKIVFVQSRIYAQEKQERIKNHFAFLNEVPSYPGKMTDNGTVYHDSRRIAVLYFSLPDNSPDEVYKWYKNALSEPPWEVVGAMKSLPEYCIKARKIENGNEQILYVGIYSSLDKGIPLVSLVTPNSPATYTCGQIDLMKK